MPLPRLFRWLLLVVAAAALAAFAGARWYFERPLPLPSSPYGFEVAGGATLGQVARDLTAAGVLPHPAPLVALARVKGVDRTIKAGNYEFVQGVTLPGLLARLTQGEVTQVAISFAEGATLRDVREALRARRDVAQEVAGLSDAELSARLGMGVPHPEGQFFPDTYFFAAGSADLAILQRSHRLLRERLDAAWAQRAPNLPLASPYEALILASIVEKETGRAAERPLVASVFVNRLRLGMKLQTDPTVIYGLGAAFDGNLRKRDLEADGPYNTYTRTGLPPTPIALPSRASLEAAVNPPATQYLYFVARGDGTSEFTTNLADHNRAVARFQLKRERR
jgi:UPF0755 protein